jgi:hypothetical protein
MVYYKDVPSAGYRRTEFVPGIPMHARDWVRRFLSVPVWRGSGFVPLNFHCGTIGFVPDPRRQMVRDCACNRGDARQLASFLS